VLTNNTTKVHKDAILIKVFYVEFHNKDKHNKIVACFIGKNDNILFISNITFDCDELSLENMENEHKNNLHPLLDFKLLGCKKNTTLTYSDELDEDDENYMPYESTKNKILQMDMIKDKKNNTLNVLINPDIYNDKKYFYFRHDLSMPSESSINFVSHIINSEFDNVHAIDFVYNMKFDEKTKRNIINKLIETDFFNKLLSNLSSIKTKKLKKYFNYIEKQKLDNSKDMFDMYEIKIEMS
jgi:hypothetical protein